MAEHLFDESTEAYLLSLDRLNRRRLVGCLFLYLFGGIKQVQMKQNFTLWGLEFDFLNWRRSLPRRGFLLREGKIAAYSKYLMQPQVPGTFCRRDLNFISLALEWQPLANLFLEFKRAGLKGYTVSQSDDFLTEILMCKDYRTYIRKYVVKKMTFLVRSYNVTISSLEADLICWSMYNILRAYPKLGTVGEGIALAKTASKRHGINLIKGYTSKKRNALSTNADGSCEKVAVSLSSAQSDSVLKFLSPDSGYSMSSHLIVGLDGSDNGSVSWENSFALKQLKESTVLNPKHRRFLSLIQGEPDEDFSRHLGVSNSDAAHRMSFEEYKSKVCEFMGISKKSSDAFLSSLKRHLGG